MALEFTRLSDVALVEEATDTANVLIEEGGEIKRVPKTEVGGGDGGEYDVVIKGWYGTISGTSFTGFHDVTLVGEFPEETLSSMLINKTRAGEIIKGKVIVMDENMENILSVCPVNNVCIVNDVNVEIWFLYKGSSLTIYVEGDLIS